MQAGASPLPIIATRNTQLALQERALEQLYVHFAQPNKLTTKQCMVLALVPTQQGQPGAQDGGTWAGALGDPATHAA
jgi:hypothetical protein